MIGFICLDMNKNGFIDLSVFKAVMDETFDKRISESNIGKIYRTVAGELNKKINIEQYSNLANTMQNMSYLFKKEPLEVWLWEK